MRVETLLKLEEKIKKSRFTITPTYKGVSLSVVL